MPAENISSRLPTDARRDRQTHKGQMKFQKEDASRKYFIQATDRRQQGQTEKQTEGRRHYKRRKAGENILSKPPTDVSRDRQKNRQRADGILKKRTKISDVQRTLEDRNII